MHPSFYPATCSSLLLAAVLWTGAAGPAAAAAPSLAERTDRSLIIGVRADLGEKAAALKKGRDRALSKARIFLSDLEKSGITGAFARSPADPVRIVAQKKQPGSAAGRPALWLATETAFTVKDHRTGGPPGEALLDRADLLDVRLWTERKEYREKEEIIVFLQGNRDFHAKVVRIDADGTIRQLLPNNYRQISVFAKGRRYRLPDEGDRYRLAALPPFGVIRFVAYATRLPMSHVNLKTVGGGLYEYRAGPKAFGRSVRQVIPVGEEGLTPFCETSWEVRTRAR